MSQSKRHFAAALQAQPNHFWAQCLLAICDLNSRRCERRRGQGISDGLPANPSRAALALSAAWIRFGTDRLEGVDPEEAVANFAAAFADYREALSRDSGGRYRYALLVNRGLLHLQSQKPDEAVADLEEAIALDPGQLSAYVTLAQIHRQRHQLDLALAALGHAIALKPKPGRALSDSSPLDARAHARDGVGPCPGPGGSRPGRFDWEYPRAGNKPGISPRRVACFFWTGSFSRRSTPATAALEIDPKDAAVHRYRVGRTPGAEA